MNIKYVVMLILWCIFLFLEWKYVQNEHIENEDLEDSEEIEIYFDLFFFLAWLMAASLMFVRIFEF